MPGTFTFRPIQANLTHDTDWLGKMDPYCSYRVGATKIKGPVCRNGGKFPKWEDATVNVPAPNDNSMVVDLMDKDKILHDGNIGTFVIDLLEIQSRGRVSKWYPVYHHKKPAGEILMEAAFNPEIVQQPVIVEPVIVRETIIEQPVIVEKVITEKHVVQPQVIQKEFHSGPVIQSISQIHHDGLGHGLVPNHSGLAHHGVTPIQASTLGHNSTYATGSTLHQGTTIPQQNFTQGTYATGSTLHQGTTIPQQNFTQGNYVAGSTLHQGTTIPQQNFTQGGLNQGFNPSLNQQKF